MIESPTVHLPSPHVRERPGVKVRAVNRDHMDEYGLDSERGVVVVWIDPRGPLGWAPFEVGDVPLQIDRQTVDGCQSLAGILSGMPRRQRATVTGAEYNSNQTAYVQVGIN